MIQKFTKERVFKDPVVTEVTPISKFYLAENYHQEYFDNNASQPYCKLVVSPKVDKFRKQFSEKLRD